MTQEDLWAFTVEMYGREGVAKLCLDLQERCGLDVNMLFFMFFLGQQGKAPHSISALETAVRDWRENVIIPLRQTRRHMRSDPRKSAQELRNRIKADELQAERIEQQILCETVHVMPDTDQWAAAHAYLSPTRFNLDQKTCTKAVETLLRLMGLSGPNGN
ncbi:TIGR02444 family protein [Thalassospira sp. MA62]|nr:TIGR02444 family protein [Thalassospira sp. MA62]